MFNYPEVHDDERMTGARVYTWWLLGSVIFLFGERDNSRQILETRLGDSATTELLEYFLKLLPCISISLTA